MKKQVRELKKSRDFEFLEKQLASPFAYSDLEWLSNFSFFANNKKDAKNLAIAVAPYIRRESVIVRLNEVLGADGWRTRAESVGTLGVFQYIEVFNGHEWVSKVDGATMKANEQISGDESKNKNRDIVKGVISKSIRRAAEAWGIGLYLHSVPQLYAIKRPDDCYDAYDKWGRSGFNFDVRWDPPVMPSEFLPIYMTPEQKVRLDRVIAYLSGEKAEKIKEMIESYDNDPYSILYDEASKIIDAIDRNVQERINRVNKFEFYPKKKPPAPDKKKKKGKPNPEKQSQDEKAEPEKASPLLTMGQNVIEEYEIAELEKMVHELSQEDSDGLYHDKKWLKDVREAIKGHKEGPWYLPRHIFDETRKKILETLDTIEADDDLPF